MHKRSQAVHNTLRGRNHAQWTKARLESHRVVIGDDRFPKSQGPRRKLDIIVRVWMFELAGALDVAESERSDRNRNSVYPRIRDEIEVSALMISPIG